MKINRIPTGVEGLDLLIEGGIPKGDSLLIAGAAGTCKTILSLHVVSNYAENGGKALYITFEEDKNRLIRHMTNLGIKARKLIKTGNLIIESIQEGSDINDIHEHIRDIVKEKKVEMVLIDSITMMFTLSRYFPKTTKKLSLRVESGIRPKGHALTRDDIFYFIKGIAKLPITAIFIDEADEKGTNLTKNGVAEFVVDGVILLRYILFGPESGRSLIIRKMRDTSHSEESHPLQVQSGTGLRVMSEFLE